MKILVDPQLLKGATHISINRDCKNITGVLSIHRDNVVSGINKFSGLKVVVRGFASEVFGIQTNAFTCSPLFICKGANCLEPDNLP